jgi:hypothetical protein
MLSAVAVPHLVLLHRSSRVDTRPGVDWFSVVVDECYGSLYLCCFGWMFVSLLLWL